MAKWADYLISEVKYTESDDKRVISKVKLHVDNDTTFDEAVIYSRSAVIALLDEGNEIITIYKKDGADEWRKGQAVEKYTHNRVDYIKTVPNKTEEDNLGELPEF